MDLKESGERARVVVFRSRIVSALVDSVALERWHSHMSIHRIVLAFEKLLERCDPMMIRPAPRASLPEIPDGTRPKDQCHDGFFDQDDNDQAERLSQSGRYASIP